MRTPEDVVRAEVLVCVSSLVSTLAKGFALTSIFAAHGQPKGEAMLAAQDLGALCEQAAELAAPIDDWAEAAIDEGWYQGADGRVHCDPDDGPSLSASDWRDACDAENPYQREVFEHWAVTPWLADQLEAHGEKVDKDFADLCVWARTTTGQSIDMDSVVEKIAVEINAGVEG